MKTPQLNDESIRAILEANGVPNSPYRDKVCVVAIRGYYLDSMGRAKVNDRRIYDDAMFIVSPRGIFAYQANTDPNGYRKGRGTGRGKGMAMLKPGVHIYAKGRHKGRLAFRQAEPFTVIRDGNPPYEHVGYHAINLHSGGYNSTSSLGCQTLPKGTWDQFRRLLYELLDEYSNPIRPNDWKQRERSFPYILIEETERRKGNLRVSSRWIQ